MLNTKNTKSNILEHTKKLFALNGYEGFTMRTLANELEISQSVLYHYFKSKDDILEVVFDTTRKELGKKRKVLSPESNLLQNLKERIDFQLEHALDVTYILKYYLHFRENFEKNNQGFVPKTAYKHILEILQKALEKNEVGNIDVNKEAKVITHAINGFILEYYPNIPKKEEKEELINNLAEFIHRSLIQTRKEVLKNGK